MKKFPVVSENGIEYLVEVKKCSVYVTGYYNNYYIYLYKKKKFWIFTFHDYLNEYFMNRPRSYDLKDYNFDIISTVKEEIVRYETENFDSIFAVNESYEGEEKVRKDFEEWDGKC